MTECKRQYCGAIADCQNKKISFSLSTPELQTLQHALKLASILQFYTIAVHVSYFINACNIPQEHTWRVKQRGFGVEVFDVCCCGRIDRFLSLNRIITCVPFFVLLVEEVQSLGSLLRPFFWHAVSLYWNFSLFFNFIFHLLCEYQIWNAKKQNRNRNFFRIILSCQDFSHSAA